MTDTISIALHRACTYDGPASGPPPVVMTWQEFEALRREVSDILEARPLLCSNGLRPHGSDRRDSAPFSQRAELVSRSGVGEIALCQRFIRERMHPLTSTARALSSYELKHRVEHASGRYVSNGAFIAALIIEGVRFDGYGVNVVPFAGLVPAYRKCGGRSPFEVAL